MNIQKEIKDIKQMLSVLIEKQTAGELIPESRMMEITGKNKRQLRHLRVMHPQIFVARENGRDIQYNYKEYLKIFKSPLA